MGVVEVIYNAIFSSPNGKGGIINSQVEELMPIALANGLLRTSILTPNYNRMLARLISFGYRRHFYRASNERMIEYIRAKVAKSGYKVNMEPPPVLAPLNMYDVQGIFYVWLLLLAISMTAFIGELLKKGNGKKTANK